MALPYGYSQVEYIESTGTQCIDTGIIPVPNIRIEVDFLLTSAQSTGGIISAELSWPTNLCSIDAWAYRYGSKYQSHTLTANKLYSVVMDNGVFTENGVTVFTGSGAVSTTIPLTVFAVNRGSSQNEFAKARLYSAKIATNGTVVRNFVPCLNPSGVPGLYDTVSGGFFGNIGSGTFLHGEIVSTIIPGITPFIAGAYRNVPEGYVCADGIWRPIVEIFTNVKGVWYSNIAKQVIYKWKKYNTVTTTKDGWAWSSTEVMFEMPYDSLITGVARAETYTPTYGNKTLTALKITGDLRLTYVSSVVSNSYYYYHFSDANTETNGNYPNDNYFYENSRVGDRLNTKRFYCYPPIYSPTTTYSQGSYIADVTAETADAYPTNGRHTDGFWYVFQG